MPLKKMKRVWCWLILGGNVLMWIMVSVCRYPVPWGMFCGQMYPDSGEVEGGGIGQLNEYSLVDGEAPFVKLDMQVGELMQYQKERNKALPKEAPFQYRIVLKNKPLAAEFILLIPWKEKSFRRTLSCLSQIEEYGRGSDYVPDIIPLIQRQEQKGEVER